MFPIYIRFSIRISKTVAMGHFCCVYQKTYRYPTWENYGLSFLLRTFSAIYVIGYTPK